MLSISRTRNEERREAGEVRDQDDVRPRRDTTTRRLRLSSVVKVQLPRTPVRFSVRAKLYHIGNSRVNIYCAKKCLHKTRGAIERCHHLAGTYYPHRPCSCSRIGQDIQLCSFPIHPYQSHLHSTSDASIANTSRKPCWRERGKECDDKRCRIGRDILSLDEGILHWSRRLVHRGCEDRTCRTKTAAGYPKFASIWNVGSGSNGLYRLNRFGP